jgi:hypothetical protein
MKRLILAGMLVLITTAAQAQGTGSNPSSHPVQDPYTTLGPAGAGGLCAAAPADQSQWHPARQLWHHGAT